MFPTIDTPLKKVGLACVVLGVAGFLLMVLDSGRDVVQRCAARPSAFQWQPGGVPGFPHHRLCYFCNFLRRFGAHNWHSRRRELDLPHRCRVVDGVGWLCGPRGAEDRRLGV